MTLTQRIGDTKTHSIPLSWSGRPFVPGNGWLLLFTAKLDPDTETDEDAIFQKTSGAGGITVTGAKALLSVLPQDTVTQEPCTLFWDIQATRDVQGAGEVRTVASGTMPLIRDVGRGSEPVLDVYSIAPPFLYFSYQAYRADTTDNPPLTEAQWVSRLGQSSPQVVSIYPPVPSRSQQAGIVFAMPYEGLEWFDPSDGSTSVWMWLGEAQENEEDGVFVSQFPTPVSTGIPDGSFIDINGDSYVSNLNEYLILS